MVSSPGLTAGVGRSLTRRGGDKQTATKNIIYADSRKQVRPCPRGIIVAVDRCSDRRGGEN